jgi:hypothetical protein
METREKHTAVWREVKDQYPWENHAIYAYSSTLGLQYALVEKRQEFVQVLGNGVIRTVIRQYYMAPNVL